MELVNYQTAWHEIEEQDRIEKGNIAIVKDARERCYNVEIGKYNGHVVLLNPLNGGDIITLGLFWTEENAVMFAEAYIKNHSHGGQTL